MRQRRTLLAICAVLIAVGTATLLAQSTLADFGIREADLKSYLVGAVVNGNIPVYPNRKTFTAASPSLRSAFVRNALAVIKTYTESAAFQAEYAKQRASAKPTTLVSKGTPDEQYAKQLADQQKSLAEMKANVAKMSSDMQKQMAPVVKQMEETFAKQAKDPQMVAMMKQGYAMQAQGNQQSCQQELARYEERYPADPKVLIARRLHQFLDLTKDIPYNAKLVPGYGGKMKFGDPQLEAKPSEWKLCYRAGKEPVDAARAFAADWLKQLGK
ncbi:MAG: hypothetical protein ACXVZX_05035 [Terriglobales bacterium]